MKITSTSTRPTLPSAPSTTGSCQKAEAWDFTTTGTGFSAGLTGLSSFWSSSTTSFVADCTFSITPPRLAPRTSAIFCLRLSR